MGYIADFYFHVENIPPSFFRIVYLDCQNDGFSQDVVFKINCFGRDQLNISNWGLKKAKIYYKNNLLFSGLLISGQGFDSQEYIGFYYEFILSSPIYLFKMLGKNRVFVNKTPEEIIDAVFLSRGWKSSQWRWKLSHNLPVMDLRVQYNQADYDFIVELLAEFNCHFIFDQEILYLTDNVNLLNKNYKYRTHHVEEHEIYRCKNYLNFLGYDFQKRFKINLLKARIEGREDNSPYLNHQGYYIIRFLFDEDSDVLQSSCPVPVITPCFMSFTLKAGTEVAVRFIDGDINKPVISGVFMDNSERLVDRYLQKSHAGHAFELSSQYIKITHANLGNFISLAENMMFESQSGEIEINAGNNININTAENIQQQIGRDKLVNTYKNLIVKTAEGNIDIKAHKNTGYSAEYKININSPESINVKSKMVNITADDINIVGQNKIEITSRNKIIMLGSKRVNYAAEGELLFQAAGASLGASAGGLIFNTAVLTVNAMQISGGFIMRV